MRRERTWIGALAALVCLLPLFAWGQYSGRASNLDQVDVRRGLNPNRSVVHKFGFNPDVDTGAKEDIWDKGGLYPWQTANQALEVLSSSALDADDSTGARTLVAVGQNLAGTEWADTLTMAGQTPVAVGESGVIVYRMWVETAGDSSRNLGNVVCRVQSAGDTLAMIAADNGQTLMSIYRVPAGKTGYITSVASRVIGGVQADVRLDLYKRPSGGAWRIQDVFGLQDAATSSDQVLIENPVVCEALTEVRLAATTDANNTGVGATFDMTLEVD